MRQMHHSISYIAWFYLDDAWCRTICCLLITSGSRSTCSRCSGDIGCVWHRWTTSKRRGRGRCSDRLLYYSRPAPPERQGRRKLWYFSYISMNYNCFIYTSFLANGFCHFVLRNIFRKSLDHQLWLHCPPTTNNSSSSNINANPGQLSLHDSSLYVVPEVRGPCDGPLCLCCYLYPFVLCLNLCLMIFVASASCFFLCIIRWPLKIHLVLKVIVLTQLLPILPLSLIRWQSIPLH